MSWTPATRDFHTRDQGESVFQSGDSVEAVVVLPPPGNAGNSGVAVQLPPQHPRKLIGPVPEMPSLGSDGGGQFFHSSNDVC
jgi:hypothetical protein